MAYIDLGVDEQALPGIQGLLTYRPETATPLMALAETLLRGPSSLTRGERELIAAHVSALNECDFCRDSHAAAAAAQLPDGMTLVEQVRADPSSAPVSARLRALLHIAEAVRRDGRAVTEPLIAEARSAGATDLEIHDTVLIAAAFAMFNRYVDGLGTRTPDDPQAYELGAQRITAVGYTAGRAPDAATDRPG
ncbi:carboxymuconolactone decarboxylase family protein [Actinoplanes sp. NPDC020271]|uniref:carboxymuconolactone decarboxylase family protein n=1 Tax=Actinoplanes sp. NPDC020271 TaxID=3363896 RepID=UPI0037A8D3B8